MLVRQLSACETADLPTRTPHWIHSYYTQVYPVTSFGRHSSVNRHLSTDFYHNINVSSVHVYISRPLGYERVYLPLHKGDEALSFSRQNND